MADAQTSPGSGPELLVLTGPTSVGKTAVALELAAELQTEIISADSMQVYRHLTIGTAKPTPEELKGAAYHLIDFVDPNYQYNLGDFVRDADALVGRLHGEGKLPIVCGGTCMYVRGLVLGIFGEETRDPEIRERLAREAEEGRLPELFAELMRIDPAATHIMPNDRQRIVRALEVYYVTGKPISQLQTQKQSPARYRAQTFILMLSREELYERINQRVDRMVELGLVDEVRNYLQMGYSRENPAINALGYAEWIDYLDGKLSFESALEAMKKKTRNYAKRQLTWFRAMRDAHVIEVKGTSAGQICTEIKKRLAKLPG